MTPSGTTPRAAPAIFDRSAQRARLARAWREGPADFLLAQVVADLLDRLAVVKR
ncbi:MAG: SAM-dependent methyltransferase, partial [Methylobacteriaceae bacterium]|nr:SAM-dependent methyltransferase [Methylobacteriaceae bacterium]